MKVEKCQEGVVNINIRKQMSIGVILSYVSIAVKLLSGILYTPLVLHTLGQNQYGVYSLCISSISYLTILNAGVNAAYIRFYVQEKTIREDNIEKLNGLFCKIFIALSIIGGVGGLLIAHFSPVIFGSKITPEEYKLVGKCFVILAFTVAVEIITCLFKSFITANEEFIFGKTLDIISAILSPVLTLPFLIRGADCTSIVGVRLGVAILILFLNIVFCWKRLEIRFSFSRTEKRLLNNISQFVGFIALQSIMDQLNWEIDKFILARAQGTSEISLYSVGSTFNTYFLLIGGAVSSVFIAEINRLVATDDEVRLNNLFRRTCKLFTYIIGFIVIAFFVFGRAFILCWVGEGYGSSFTIGWMLMFPVTFSLIMGLGQDIARAKNKHQAQIIINICVCILNMFVSIPLAIQLGAVGSAFGTFIAEIIVCILVQPAYYKKVLGINVGIIFLDMLRYLPGIVIPIGFGVLINYFGLLKQNYSSIIIYGMVFVFIYIFSILTLSLNKADRAYVFNIIKKRKA